MKCPRHGIKMKKIAVRKDERTGEAYTYYLCIPKDDAPHVLAMLRSAHGEAVFQECEWW